MNNRNGFTLAEVLVSIGLVMLLSAVVYAALGPAREQTRQTACRSNLQQIGRALQMYMTDYDGVEPVVGQQMSWTDAGLPPIAGLNRFVRGYIRNRAVLMCPSYHDRTPRGRTFMSYALANPDAPYIPPKFRFSEIVKQRGPDTPVLTCDQHNTLDQQQAPRWETMLVQVLRLSGQVDHRRVPVRSFYYEW